MGLVGASWDGLTLSRLVPIIGVANVLENEGCAAVGGAAFSLPCHVLVINFSLGSSLLQSDFFIMGVVKIPMSIPGLSFIAFSNSEVLWIS